MDKQQLIKLHKADFTQAYLAVQNGLGGNPLTLLMSESSVDAIELAMENLEAMLFIASSCHAKSLDEKAGKATAPDEAPTDGVSKQLNTDLSQMVDSVLKAENTPESGINTDKTNLPDLTDESLKQEDDSGKTSKAKSKQKSAKSEKTTDDSEQQNGSSEQ